MKVIKKQDASSVDISITNPKTNLFGHTDTSWEIEKLYLEKIAQMSANQRVRRVIDMSNALMNQSFRVLHETNPQCSENELGLLFVKIHYGEKIFRMCEKIMIERSIVDNNWQDKI